MGQTSIKKSGRNIHLGLMATTYDRLRSGHRDDIANVQQPVSANSIACFEVLVQADPDNVQDVWLGVRDDGCHIHLEPGDVIVMPINNVNKVYARADSGTMRVNWIAGV